MADKHCSYVVTQAKLCSHWPEGQCRHISKVPMSAYTTNVTYFAPVFMLVR